MKYLFGIGFVLFAVLFVVAQVTLVGEPQDGKVHLLWATDPNPARLVQTRQFGTMFPDATVAVDRGDAMRLITRCATGTGPDLMDIYSIAQLQTLAETGVLLDLTPYAKEMGFDPSRTYPALKNGLKIEGKQYMFPCNVSADAVIYNKLIFDDHGLPYPDPNWTWDDFAAVGRQLRETPSQSGKKHMPVANWANLAIVGNALVGYGARSFTPDGLTCLLDSNEAIAALQLYSDLMHVHHVLPTPAEAVSVAAQGGWGSGGLTWFSSGKAAMIVIGRWYIVQVPNWPNIQGHLGAVPLPHAPGRPSSGAVGCRGPGINAKSLHIPQALEFLQYLASREYGEVIVQDGDAMPPNPDVARTGRDLVNEAEPDPAFHQVFIDAIKNARTDDVSPFMDANEVDRWFQERVEAIENKLQSPPDAMRSLAAEINQKIRHNLERRPDLQRKFEQVTGRPYTSDWWKTLQKPPTEKGTGGRPGLAKVAASQE